MGRESCVLGRGVLDRESCVLGRGVLGRGVLGREVVGVRLDAGAVCK